MTEKHHRFSSTSSVTFRNPWQPLSTMTGSALAFLRLPFSRALSLPGIDPAKTIPLDHERIDSETQISATWLGHAGAFVQFPGTSSRKPIRILLDPIFSDRASPSEYFGPKRRIPAPCTIEELLPVDFVVISHNHYDHCDITALQRLWNASTGQLPHFLVPLGNKELLLSLAIPSEHIHEMDWWDSKTFPTSDSSHLELVCTPAQHNSGRGILDQNHTLWASWSIRHIAVTSDSDPRTLASLYFAGDTGYQTVEGPCPVFKEIGQRFGPFDLAFIPIWRGASLSLLGKLGYRLADDTPLVTLHASPEDAVKLFHDVQAKRAIAMHFGTFAGSENEAVEPVVRLVNALKGGSGEYDYTKEKYAWRDPGGGFGWLDAGETALVLAAE